MKLSLFAALAAILCVPAAAQDITLEGVVRASSLYAAIAEFCPQHQLVDVQLATRTAKAMADVAREALGPNVSRAALRRELERRFEEVRVTGPAPWCGYQKQRPTNRSVFPSRRR